MTPPIICLTGPTAAGKSAAVRAVAARWPIEVINVDSATIYRGMDIGTAKPSKAEQQQTPQHLLDIIDPADRYSAAQFAQTSLSLMTEIVQRGRLPLLCGGTMLYYKALREGLNDLPPANAQIRADIDREARQLGWPALHRRLQAFDPITARRLEPNDSQRVQRAIEIYRITGQSMSTLLKAERPARAAHQYVTISLEPSDRGVLHTRIERRYRQMIADGLIAEVETLHERPDLHTGLPSMRCVGYRQLWDYLDGATSLDQANEQAIAATRQLAKRQLTWLRAQPQRLGIDCLAHDACGLVVDQIARIWPPAA